MIHMNRAKGNELFPNRIRVPVSLPNTPEDEISCTGVLGNEKVKLHIRSLPNTSK